MYPQYQPNDFYVTGECVFHGACQAMSSGQHVVLCTESSCAVHASPPAVRSRQDCMPPLRRTCHKAQKLTQACAAGHMPAYMYP